MATPPGTAGVAKKRIAKREYVVGGLALVLTLAFCVATVYYWEYIIRLDKYGYAGVFVISILAGATVFVPIPGLLVVFTLGSILKPAIVGALAGLGETIGSMVIYLTGYGSRRVFQNTNQGFYTRFAGWLHRYGSVAVFINSVIFNPLFYPFAAMAGMVRFSLIKFFLVCWAGRTVKCMIVAYAGYFGLRSVLRWLGIPL